MRFPFVRLASICVAGFALTTLPPVSISALSPMAHFVAPQGGGVKVWVNRSSGVYHCPGTRYYGSTKRGEYMLESEAGEAGARPAYGRRCGGVSSNQGERPSGPRSGLPVRSERLPQTEAGTKVWVNTKSMVYHCPGSPYYGNTKSGVYMTEGSATSGGNRAAYGKSCS